MKKTLIILSILLILVSASVFVFKDKSANFLVSKLIKSSCNNCNIKFKKAEYIFSTGALKLDSIDFRYKKPQSIDLKITIPELSLNIAFKNLLESKIKVRDITIQGADIIHKNFTNSKTNKSSSPDSSLSRELKYEFEKVKLKNANYTYVSVNNTKEASLFMNDISGTMSVLSNIESTSTTKVSLSGQIENAGHIKIDFESKINNTPLNFSMDVVANNYPLSKLNPFFKNDASIAIEGLLKYVKANLKYSNRSSTTHTDARFKDLNIIFHEGKGRGGMKSFFMNLGEAVTIQKTNLKKERKYQVQSVKVKRMQDEGISAFVLRSLRESAVKVAEY